MVVEMASSPPRSPSAGRDDGTALDLFAALVAALNEVSCRTRI